MVARCVFVGDVYPKAPFVAPIEADVYPKPAKRASVGGKILFLAPNLGGNHKRRDPVFAILAEDYDKNAFDSLFPTSIIIETRSIYDPCQG